MPEGLADRFRRFADEEAAGISPVYEALARRIADSAAALDFLRSLPAARRQPNLFLAALRTVTGLPENGAALETAVREQGTALASVMLSRTTQTNEPARCAVLLPVLARLRQPLALIEVGASAGLCLLPDRYGYDYGSVRIAPRDPAAPVFQCDARGCPTLPDRLPEVVWRRGLDLNPLDVTSDDDMRWLETLVWPGMEDRLGRLKAAIAVARAESPLVEQGDLTRDLEALIARVPEGATPVVFHTAVLAYVTDADVRARFAETMRRSRAVWISNETPRVFPDITAKAPPAPQAGMFLLSVDGEPVAWTGPHGQSLDWFAGDWFAPD